MSTTERIEKILKRNFKVLHLEVTDDSAGHANHPEAKKSGGGHFDVVIVASDFQGKTRLERHRMIYQALKEVKELTHALKIKALTPDEYQKSSHPFPKS